MRGACAPDPPAASAEAAEDVSKVKAATGASTKQPATAERVTETMETGEAPATSTSTSAAAIDPKRIYVGGLPYEWTEDDIRDFFRPCGKASAIDMLLFPDSGRFRGIAFVSFYSPNAAADALRKSGCTCGEEDRCVLKIKPCAPKVDKAEAASEAAPVQVSECAAPSLPFHHPGGEGGVRGRWKIEGLTQRKD